MDKNKRRRQPRKKISLGQFPSRVEVKMADLVDDLTAQSPALLRRLKAFRLSPQQAVMLAHAAVQFGASGVPGSSITSLRSILRDRKEIRRKLLRAHDEVRRISECHAKSGLPFIEGGAELLSETVRGLAEVHSALEERIDPIWANRIFDRAQKWPGPLRAGRALKFLCHKLRARAKALRIKPTPAELPAAVALLNAVVFVEIDEGHARTLVDRTPGSIPPL